MKSTTWILLSFGLLTFLACKRNKLSPGIEYMPDMYRGPAIEVYVDYVYNDSISARMPAKGSIPRGFKPYAYSNTPEGYEEAGKNLKNPYQSELVLDKGKDLFLKFCSHCHGEKGLGDGSMVKNDKFPAPPSYLSNQLIALPVGKMYHTIMYGKGLMGSHAAQLNDQERWMIINYILKLQKRI